LVTLLAACDRSGEIAVNGQVIARVNGREITAHQFNTASRLFSDETDAPIARQTVLNRLVDRELAAQQAISDKLDRRPEVLMELEEARRNVLVQALAREYVRNEIGESSDSVGAKHYADHPELFAKRKIYLLRIHYWPDTLGHGKPLRTKVAEGRPVGDIVKWLESNRVDYVQRVMIRPAEDVPTAIVKALPNAPVGQAVFLEHPQGVIAYQVLASESAPLTWLESRENISRHLARQRADRLFAERMKGLRRAANVEYLGEFAALAHPASANP
jgi:EpsD family peptidyl-prolyl cis-trans isomerase